MKERQIKIVAKTSQVKKQQFGPSITTMVEVIQMANQGKAVVYRGARVPAAFIQNFQARHLYNEIKRKVLYYYIPKTRPTNR